MNHLHAETTITLRNAQWTQILTELRQLYGYHWNDDKIRAGDCGSKILDALESKLAYADFKEVEYPLTSDELLE